jgi:deazaflavin-dependent oxidoreductase (nitroreductase family)
MPIRRRLARFNRLFANHIVGRIIPRMPGFGAVYHSGRKSGREYRTPVKVFRRADGYVMSLPYGSDSDWVKNVLAAGGCDLMTRGHRVHLVSPDVFIDNEQDEIPAFLRVALKRVNATEFIALKFAEAMSPRP